MDRKETSGIDATQALWHDLILNVLHDTSSHVLFAHKDSDGSYRLSERMFRLIHARIHSDRELLMYIGQAAIKIPQHYMRGDELFNAIEHVLSFGGHGWYFGYSLYNESQTLDDLIACPGFTVNAILACMFFRIPCGTTKEPTELVFSLSENSLGGGKSNASIDIRTRFPLSNRKTAHIQIEDEGVWDPWHHSWGVAYECAEKYQGKCSAFITSENQMVVTLELPVLSVVEPPEI